jgi:hypothetical protein
MDLQKQLVPKSIITKQLVPKSVINASPEATCAQKQPVPKKLLKHCHFSSNMYSETSGIINNVEHKKKNKKNGAAQCSPMFF